MSGVLQPPIRDPKGPRPAVRLWRIEHPQDDIGPFQSCNWSGHPRRILEKACRAYSMPTPQADRVVRRGELRAAVNGVLSVRKEVDGHLRFAFTSLRDLRYWFGVDGLREVEALGYVVRVIAAPWTAHTRYRHQARFDAKRAIVLRTLQPTHVLDM